MKSLFLVILLLVSTSAFSQSTISYRIEATMDSYSIGDIADYFDEIKEAGWRIENEEDEYDRKFIHSGRDISVDDLPITIELTDEFTIRIFKTQRSHKISLDYSMGDMDGTSAASSYLSVSSSEPNIVTMDGGDHASGSWSVDAKAIVWLKP